jgi:molecular chaperone GrpE
MATKRRIKIKKAADAEEQTPVTDERPEAAVEEEAPVSVTEPAEQEEVSAETVESIELPADPLTELQTRVDQLEDKLLRARAEAQNQQKRAAAEHAEAIRYANAGLMRSLLGVLDDFERSLAALENDDTPPAVVKGVRLIYENLLKVMREGGLGEIEALHKPFDPSLHEAMMQQPNGDHPDGTVIEEVARGYRLHDRVIRPSKVVVSKAPEKQDAAKDKDEPSG